MYLRTTAIVVILSMIDHAIKKFPESTTIFPNKLKYVDVYSDKREFRVRICEPKPGKDLPIIYVDVKEANSGLYKQISHGWLKSHGPEIKFGQMKGA